MPKINRPKVTEKQLESSITLVLDELKKKIKKKGPGAMISSHECLGVLDEEFDEFKVEVQKNDTDAQITEAVDVALTAIWVIASLRTLQNEDK